MRCSLRRCVERWTNHCEKLGCVTSSDWSEFLTRQQSWRRQKLCGRSHHTTLTMCFLSELYQRFVFLVRQHKVLIFKWATDCEDVDMLDSVVVALFFFLSRNWSGSIRWAEACFYICHFLFILTAIRGESSDCIIIHAMRLLCLYQRPHIISARLSFKKLQNVELGICGI